MIEREEALRKRFTYHPPSENQLMRYRQIRAEGLRFAQAIVDLTPESREQTHAINNVDQAISWASESITRNEQVSS